MKIRAILTIVISILVGFVFGFLTSGQIKKQEAVKKHKHSFHEMFVYKTLGVIEPGEAQKDTLLPIIMKYSEKTMVLKNKVSSEFDSLIHEMSLDLKPYVSSEQYKKLEENELRLREKYKR